MRIFGVSLLQWCDNKRDGVSNHRRLDGLLNRLSLAFVRRIHRWPVDFSHKGSVTRKMFPFDGIIMLQVSWCHYLYNNWNVWKFLYLLFIVLFIYIKILPNIVMTFNKNCWLTISWKMRRISTLRPGQLFWHVNFKTKCHITAFLHF